MKKKRRSAWMEVTVCITIRTLGHCHKKEWTVFELVQITVNTNGWLSGGQ